MVRIGFIGVGGIAASHIRELRQIDEVQIVALCDVDADRVRAAAEPLGAETYADGGELIDEAKLDALYICVPPYAHGDLEVRAARKGLHLFVEKPVNLYLEQARRAADAIRKAGVLSQSGYVLRYTPGGEQLKAFLAHKQVGTANVIRWSGLPDNPWWRQYDRSGGQLVEMTTHQVDLLRWVLGEIDAVSSFYSLHRLHEGMEGVTVPDSQTVLLRFASGATATINTSCAAGKAGLMSMEFVIRDARVTWQGAGIKVEPSDIYKIPPAPANPLSIDQAFVQSVRTGNSALLRSPYEDAMKTVAVTLAANRSAEQGGRIVHMSEVLPA